MAINKKIIGCAMLAVTVLWPLGCVMDDDFMAKGKMTFSVDGGVSQTWYTDDYGVSYTDEYDSWYIRFEHPSNNCTFEYCDLNEIVLSFDGMGYYITQGEYASTDDDWNGFYYDFDYYPLSGDVSYIMSKDYEFTITVLAWPGPERTARGTVSGTLDGFAGASGTIQFEGEFEFTLPQR